MKENIMVNVTIFGQGNMGKAIGENFMDAGNDVEYITTSSSKTTLGDLIVLAVPYSAVDEIIEQYGKELEGKTVVDITNPVNFETFDDLVVPSDSSAAEVISKKLPETEVIKGFNTTFAATLTTKKVADQHQTTVLFAGESKEAKDFVIKALEGSGLATLDAGSLKRARELEAMGFLQISLASSEKISWGGGFGVFK
jgi:predicted dinucleotide-binding enzyme